MSDNAFIYGVGQKVAGESVAKKGAHIIWHGAGNATYAYKNNTLKNLGDVEIISDPNNDLGGVTLTASPVNGVVVPQIPKKGLIDVNAYLWIDTAVAAQGMKLKVFRPSISGFVGTTRTRVMAHNKKAFTVSALFAGVDVEAGDWLYLYPTNDYWVWLSRHHSGLDVIYR